MTTRILSSLLLLALTSGALSAQHAGPPRAGLAEVNGAQLYYELHGSGAPLVLIEGLGTATWLWEQQVPAFAEHFTTVVYDNRGVGRSEAPAGPYSIGLMADDLAALLDTLGVERAHVLGVSLGGFIAQEFALRYPERVDRLILVSTSAGGATHVPMGPEAIARFMTPADDPRSLILQRLPLAFTDAYLADSANVERLVAQRLERPQPPQGYQGQLAAGSTFDAADRVQAITAPTLVAAADADVVVPVENGRRLAEALPNAEFVVYPGYGHQFFVEIPERFNRDVIDFLHASEPDPE